MLHATETVFILRCCIFWCAFHLFHNKATDKAAQRLNTGQKRKRLGRGRGKESRGLCLLSFVLSSIVFSSNLLPQVFSFFNTIGKKSNRQLQQWLQTCSKKTAKHDGTDCLTCHHHSPSSTVVNHYLPSCISSTSTRSHLLSSTIIAAILKNEKP